MEFTLVIKEWLAVAIGGMLGTLLRHAVGLWTRGLNPQWLPAATLSVNILGCLMIGALYKWTVDRQWQGTWWEIAARVGFLGGLTTFSSFGLDVLQAWQSRPLVAILLIAAHVILGLGAVALGMQLVK